MEDDGPSFSRRMDLFLAEVQIVASRFRLDADIRFGEIVLIFQEGHMVQARESRTFKVRPPPAKAS